MLPRNRAKSARYLDADQPLGGGHFVLATRPSRCYDICGMLTALVQINHSLANIRWAVMTLSFFELWWRYVGNFLLIFHFIQNYCWFFFVRRKNDNIPSFFLGLSWPFFLQQWHFVLVVYSISTCWQSSHIVEFHCSQVGFCKLLPLPIWSYTSLCTYNFGQDCVV